MKKPAQHPIAEVPRRQAKVEITIGIDLGPSRRRFLPFFAPKSLSYWETASSSRTSSHRRQASS